MKKSVIKSDFVALCVRLVLKFVKKCKLSQDLDGGLLNLAKKEENG